MSETAFLKHEPVEQTRCIKCGQRQATREDKLCDTCRFMAAIDGIAKTNQ